MATRITKHASPLLLRRGVRGEAGQPLEIVLHLPTAPALSLTGFEFDSAFPGPSMLGAVPLLVAQVDAHPGARLLAFGHADEAGSEAYNKKLGDRRAKCLLALLTQDLSLFDQVAKDDGWKLIHYQATLRYLGIAPMEVDGKPGPMTTRGVKRFQQSYNGASYHPEGGRERAYGEIKVDGQLGPRTEAALRDAYLNQTGAKLDAARFFGPKTAGCGEFNRMGSPEQDRRAVLTLYRPDFPAESKIPCKEGDAGACTINKKAKHAWKCNFYRRTIEAEIKVEGPPLPVSVKILVQTVDELGYRLGDQTLTFFDDAGTESAVVTNEKGVFDGKVSVASASLNVRLPDGSVQVVWNENIPVPAIIYLTIRGTGATEDEAVAVHYMNQRLYDRALPALRVASDDAVEPWGEPWSDISTRVRGAKRGSDAT